MPIKRMTRAKRRSKPLLRKLRVQDLGLEEHKEKRSLQKEDVAQREKNLNSKNARKRKKQRRRKERQRKKGVKRKREKRQRSSNQEKNPDWERERRLKRSWQRERYR